MMKWNVYSTRDIGSVWEDELPMMGLSDLEERRIRELPMDRAFTDSSDTVWHRVQ